MEHLYKILIFTLSIFSFGCSNKTNSPLEEVLELAGSNRSELKQVITHYKANLADSLKLKAAEFLILNMPGKYTESYNAPWEDIATVNMRWSSSSNKFKVQDTYKIGSLIRQDDIKHITADYLISNIDLAFQVWNDKPWGKYISFDTFCEDILPYRIGTEPLESWREKVLASFADVNNMLKEDSTITAVEACKRVNDILPRFRMDKDFSNMSFTQLMATTRGQCDSQAALATFVMRALGIPVTIDFTPQWKSYSTGHDWNSVSDSAGQHISFLGTETNPYASHQGNTYQKAKAYRNTFKINKVINADPANAPTPFCRNLYDISSEHKDMINVSLPISDKLKENGPDVYLSLFYDFEWRITGHANVDSDSIYFQHIGKDILYLPVYYTNENQTPAGEPFYIDDSGEIHSLTSSSCDSLMSFSSIASENDMPFNWRMVNGVFESSKNLDFSDAKIIYKISETPELYNKVTLEQPLTSRYIRYRSPSGGSCNVSEIVFCDISGNKLEGRYIGLPGSYNNWGDTGDKAFDGDITTFYDAVDIDNSWTGLDFGEQKEIATIFYSPRLSGVGVYKGYEYELFCWTDNGWKSIETKVATEQTIAFKIPRNGLLYISNKTTGKRVQVFFILNNSVFYYT